MDVEQDEQSTCEGTGNVSGAKSGDSGSAGNDFFFLLCLKESNVFLFTMTGRYDESDDSENEDEEANDGEETEEAEEDVRVEGQRKRDTCSRDWQLPVKTYLRGLYPGQVPVELTVNSDL